MVTFFHDHIFLKYKNEYYTSGSLNSDVMKRYIKPFGKIRLVTRQKEVESVKGGIKPSSVPNTEFVAVPNYKSVKNLLKYFKARKIIKDEVVNAEFIILRTSSFANVAARYARKYNKPYLVEVVGCAWDSAWNYSLLGKFIAPFSYYMQKETVKGADYAVYVTNTYLQKRYPTNGVNIGCSDVALPLLDESVLERRLNKINQMKNDNPVILGTTAAIDVRYKGQEYVIKAISKLNKQGYNFEYHLAGGGDNSYLKSLAEKYCVTDKVIFLGSLQHDKVFEYLDNIDIYIQPSMTEGLPRALVEAMSRGCPSIGSNAGGIPELISLDFIFKSKKTNDLLKKMIKMDKNNMYKEAEKNFNKVKEFDKELLSKRRTEFYRSYKEVTNSYD